MAKKKILKFVGNDTILVDITTKKSEILEFLNQFSTDHFEKTCAEPAAVAFETYLKSNISQEPMYWYFEIVYREWLNNKNNK